MTLQPDNEIAALFDPNFDEPEPVIVPPGALPPSWAAAMAANRSAATPAPAPAQELAWSQAPNSNIAAPAPVAVPSPAPDAEPEPTAKGERGGKKRGRRSDPEAEFTRQAAAAKKRADRERKAVRLALVGVEGNVTRTRRQSTAWFVQPPGPWNMRPVGKQRRYIQNEGLVVANLAEAG
ncbi:hypothetical protein EEB14_60340, partial [Rhodococcus sp. WS4]